MQKNDSIEFDSFRDESERDDDEIADDSEKQEEPSFEKWGIVSGPSVDDDFSSNAYPRERLQRFFRIVGLGFALLLRLALLGVLLVLLIMLFMVSMNSFSRAGYFFITILSFVIVELLFAMFCIAPCLLCAIKCKKHTNTKPLDKRRKSKHACGLLTCDFLCTFIFSQVVIALLLPNICLFTNSLGEAIGSVSIWTENVELLPPSCNYSESFTIAKQFYRCANVDFTDIRVNIGGMVDWIGDAPAMAAGNLVMIRHNQTYWNRDYRCIDTSTMVHEIAHVWQHQNAPLNVASYVELLQQQIVNRSGEINVYSYGNLSAQWNAGKRFIDFNVEQQASIVQDTFRTRPRNTSALYKYASRVIFEKCQFEL